MTTETPDRITVKTDAGNIKRLTKKPVAPKEISTEPATKRMTALLFMAGRALLNPAGFFGEKLDDKEGSKGNVLFAQGE